jgi:formylglycine-generating enzyme required for sulfatase activity
MYPVTQAEYEKVTGNNPSWFSKQGGGKGRVANQDTGRFPVEMVTWEDAVAFCESLTTINTKRPNGWAYALPTEAEWEYACRAGTKAVYSFGDDATQLAEYAWYDGNSGTLPAKRTHAVGTRKANPWGTYDMHGYVFQWCADRYGEYQDSNKKDPKGPNSGTYRVFHGGSWHRSPQACRAACRNTDGPDNRRGDVGFRVVLRPS